MSSKKDVKIEVMYHSVTRYFLENPEPLEALKDLSRGTSDVSSRFMEWFLTTYCKTNPVVIYSDGRGGYNKSRTATHKERINVHVEFRSHMRSLTKALFDPFRRKHRVTFVVNDDLSIDTTLAQMNYMRWAFQSGVYRYMRDLKKAGFSKE